MMLGVCSNYRCRHLYASFVIVEDSLLSLSTRYLAKALFFDAKEILLRKTRIAFR